MYCATKFALIGFVRSLAQAEKREGVRVMAICPGLVHTRLWTDRPEIMRNFFYDKGHTMEPIDVAERMVEMCQQKDRYRGGVIFETSVFGNRVVPEWNVEAPKHPLLGVGTGGREGDSYGHVTELLKRERGVALKSLL